VQSLQADAALDMLKREYIHESLNYVLKIQEVQERIKFEFVEILLGFMSGWLVFYHLGHEVAEDAKEYMTDLQHKVQKVSWHTILIDYFVMTNLTPF
jgi:FMN phosphatase YigB (HAD superfamily)